MQGTQPHELNIHIRAFLHHVISYLTSGAYMYVAQHSMDQIRLDQIRSTLPHYHITISCTCCSLTPLLPLSPFLTPSSIHPSTHAYPSNTNKPKIKDLSSTTQYTLTRVRPQEGKNKNATSYFIFISNFE